VGHALSRSIDTAKGKEAMKALAKTINEPKERRTFIGSLINADLW
jgi:hypothetical protein